MSLGYTLPPSAIDTYKVTRDVFRPQDLDIKTLEDVRLELSKRPDIASFISTYGMENVCYIARKLLLNGIFTSNQVARKEFPDLFRPRTAFLSQHTECEEDIIKHEDKFMKAAREGTRIVTAWRDRPKVNEGKDSLDCRSSHSSYSSSHQSQAKNDLAGIPMRMLEKPIQLPFRVQYRLFLRLQDMLQNCIYQFVSEHLPFVTYDKEWSCPEAANLLDWVEVLRQHQDSPSLNESFDQWEDIDQVGHSIEFIHHALVYRVLVSRASLLELLHSCRVLALTLRDVETAELFDGILKEVRATLEEVALERQYLQARLDERWNELQLRRQAIIEEQRHLLTTTVITKNGREERLYNDMDREVFTRLGGLKL